MTIAVVGDVMLDRYWLCETSRSKPNPERPNGRAYGVLESYALGGAAAVAALAKHLDGEVTLHGSIGDDAEAEVLRRLCVACGIRGHWAATADRTTVKTRLVFEGSAVHDHRFDLDGRGGALLLDGIEEASVIVVQDYGKGAVTREVIEAITRRRRDESTVVIVDPALGRDPRMYRGVDLIKANGREASAWYPMVSHAVSTDAAVSAFAKDLGIEIIVTKGDQGLTIWGPTGTKLRDQPAVKVDRVVDVCGAGDTIVAALAVRIAENDSLFDACEYAVACAAVQIQGIGCTPVAPVEKTVEV